MASNHHFKRPNQPLSSSSTSYFYIFVSIIALTSLFLLSSHYLAYYSSPPVVHIESLKPTKQYVSVNNDDNGAASAACDYSEGKWFYDPTVRPPRYDETCKEIYKGWNCVAGNRSGAAEIVKWRWQPNHCALPQFDPLRFLESYRNISIGFVGDSLNRNMFVSLFCSLRHVTSEVKKWRPAGADRAFTFLKYNLTIAYHRTNLLARYDGRLIPKVVSWNLLGIKRVTELMLMWLKELGQMLQVFIMFSSLTLAIGGGPLRSLTL